MKEAARMTQEHFKGVQSFGSNSSNKRPPVILTSCLEGTGIDDIWDIIYKKYYNSKTEQKKEITAKREKQLNILLDQQLESLFKKFLRIHPKYDNLIQEQEYKLVNKKTTPRIAASQILNELINY